jgi:hypothetical protein
MFIPLVLAAAAAAAQPSTPATQPVVLTASERGAIRLALPFASHQCDAGHPVFCDVGLVSLSLLEKLDAADAADRAAVAKK